MPRSSRWVIVEARYSAIEPLSPAAVASAEVATPVDWVLANSVAVTEPPRAPTPAPLDGAALYDASCAGCHTFGSRITSYNVCYTKLLRRSSSGLEVGGGRFAEDEDDGGGAQLRVVLDRNNFV